METAVPSTVLQPFRLGGITLRNRIVWGPHSTHYADRWESQRLTDYYVERAAGGVGMIVHEPVVVHPSSVSRHGKIWGFDPANVVEYRRTTDAVHAEGAAIVCQLIHNGRQVDGHSSGMPAWYPSEVTRPGTGETTHAMTAPEVREVIDGFAESARICVQGGFDGVELHAAHGYLLQAFLSPTTNSRDDDYGGDAERRHRILLEAIAQVRATIGPDRVLGVRICADEYVPDGIDLPASVSLATVLAAGGSVDYLSVVSGSLAAPDRIVPDMSFPRALNADLAAQITKAVRSIGDGKVGKVATLVTGRVAEPADAERIIASGAADLVGIVRALIADPQWVRKAELGEPQSIRPCVHANDCRDAIAGRRHLQCMVNPEVGDDRTVLPIVGGATSAFGPAKPRTHQQNSERPGDQRPVVVVGAGPAGMECALTVAANNRRVVLFERADEVGGQLRLAGMPQARSEYRRLVSYLAGRVAVTAAVDLRLGSPADITAIGALDPAVVVLAVGARPAADCPDTDLGPWTSTWRALDEHHRAGAELAVYDLEGGNGWSYWSAVESLAERGHRITAVSPGSQPAAGVESGSVGPLLGRLQAAGVRLLTSARIERDSGGDLLVRQRSGAITALPGVDLVVDPGRRSADDLSGGLRARGFDVRQIGDALAPRRIATAIGEGRAIGHGIG